MSIDRSVYITLDTNVLDILHTPDREPKHMEPADARAFRQAIVDGKIVARVSEGSAFVECLSFEKKLEYLSVVLTEGQRPAPDPQRVAVFDDLASIGITMMHAPLIGAEKFIDSMDWAPDDLVPIAERQEKFGAFIRRYPRHHPLMAYGEALLPHQPPVPIGKTTRTGPSSVQRELPLGWAIALKREWDAADNAGRKKLRRKIGPLIGEWCDTVIVGSHVGYGHDVFCTVDRGKDAGQDSLLFHGNRAKLKAEGVVIRTPTEVLTMELQ